MSQIFSPSPRRAHQIAEQETGLTKVDEIAEHTRHTHALIEQMRDVLEAADPLNKYESSTLDPNQEVIVRYEVGRHRYAIYTTEIAGTLIKVKLPQGSTFTIFVAGPDWVPMDYPPGTQLLSGDTARHVILVRMSNLLQPTSNRPVSNIDTISVYNLAAATTSQTEPDRTNTAWRGVRVYVNITAIGTGSITVTIQGKDPVTGTYYTILASAALVANAFTVLEVYPGITAAANVSASDTLPKTWRIIVTANNANPATYSVSAGLEV